MAPRRTPRQLVFDDWTEDGDFRPEVEHLITSHFGGVFMHIDRVTLRRGQTITPSNVPWPDVTVWFPDRTPVADARWGQRVLHLAELKTHSNPVLRHGQPELFATLAKAGQAVPLWQPRHLDDLIPETLEAWSGIPRPAELFVPQAPRLKKELAAA